MNEYAALVESYWQGKRKYSKTHVPSATLFTINPRWVGLWPNPGFTRWEFGT